MKSTVIDTIEQMDQYKEEWDLLRQECHASIFSSFDFTRLWLNAYRSAFTPQMILIEDRGKLVGAAPLCSHKYSTAGLPVRGLIMIGNGANILGYSLETVMARDDDKEAVREMVRALSRSRWNLMQVSDIDPLPASLRFLDLIKQEFEWQPYHESFNLMYEFPPEGDIGARFATRTRTSLRSARRGLEKEGRLQFRAVRTVEEAEAAMRLYVDMHVDRWAKKGGSIYRDPRNARLLVEMGKLVVGAGTGAIYELLIDGEIAAQIMSFFDGEMVRAYRIGMNDKFSDYSPGKLAIMLCMESQRAQGYKSMDLLHGNEPYKNFMKTHERSLLALQVKRGSLRAIAKVRSFPPIQRLDRRLGMSERMIRGFKRG
jgi:CelD/BcsL family acetyltransferase involved in cellulose biosynthesis